MTGGASHIGQEIVWALAAEGAHIAIVDRDERQAERTMQEGERRGGKFAGVFAADVGERGQAEAACATAMEQLGGINVLVTNVGYNHPDFFLNIDPGTWDRLLAVNLGSVMSCVHSVLPAMVRQGHGAIVATASTAAFGEQRQSVYAAAKAGVVAFIRTIALEYGRNGIRANLVAPGLTLPESDAALGAQSLWHDRDAIMNDAQVDYVVQQHPAAAAAKGAQTLRTPSTFSSPTTSATDHRSTDLRGRRLRHALNARGDPPCTSA